METSKHSGLSELLSTSRTAEKVTEHLKEEQQSGCDEEFPGV